MTYSEKNVKLIKALSDAIGPSGFEDEVLDVVREALADICTFEEDKVRNLYIYRRNHTGEKPVLMLLCLSPYTRMPCRISSGLPSMDSSFTGYMGSELSFRVRCRVYVPSALAVRVCGAMGEMLLSAEKK